MYTMPRLKEPFDTVWWELQKIASMIDEEMQIEAGNKLDYFDIKSNWMDKFFYPAMLNLSARLVGRINPRTIAMACVIEFINMASQTHMKYSNKGPFPVLIGDFLYAKFFLILHRYQMLEKLEKLSRVICEINEAGVLSYQLDFAGRTKQFDLCTIARKERGLLMAETCRLGCELAGGSETEAEKLYNFGLNLGTFWGLIRRGGENRAVNKFWNRAENYILLFPSSPERNALEKVLDLFHEKPEDATKLMVG